MDNCVAVCESTCPAGSLLPLVLFWIHTDRKKGWLPRDNVDQRKELGSSSEIPCKEGKTSKATESKSPFLGLLRGSTQREHLFENFCVIISQFLLCTWDCFHFPYSHTHKLLNYIYLYWDTKVRCNLPNRTNWWKSIQWKRYEAWKAKNILSLPLSCSQHVLNTTQLLLTDTTCHHL